MSSLKRFTQIFAVTLISFTAISMAGCGIGSTLNNADPTATASSLGTIQGRNMGGHAPIVNAEIFVLEATTNGYGAVAKSLLSASYSGTHKTFQDTSGGVTNGLYYVPTDTTGSFNITGDYMCDVGQPVYLYAAGGSPSTGGTGPANPAIVNMAMLGVCGTSLNFSSLNFVTINEVSTVAMAYAMAGFATDSLHIGSSPTNLVGLKNAALNANILYNVQGSGQANAVNPNNPNGTVPQTTIHTLANIVANCVDSGNMSVGTTPAAIQAEKAQCSGLFLATTSNGVTATSTVGGTNVPIDTGTAMINLAHYPAGINTYSSMNTAMDSTNPGTLFGLPSASVPFTPQLPSSPTPTDWTIALTYKNLPTPSALAIDASGDAYIGTYSTSTPNVGYITELSPQGSVNATTTTAVPSLTALAVSTGATPTVWATSHSNPGELFKFSSTLGTGNSFSASTITDPTAMAVDSTGNVYVVNNYATYPFVLQEFSSTGATNYSSSGNYSYSVANGIAMAANDDVWVSSTNSSLGLYPNPSAANNATAIYSVSSNGVNAFAVDCPGNAWVSANGNTNALLRQYSTTSQNPTYFGVNKYDNGASGGLSNPVALAIDGSIVTTSNKVSTCSTTYNVWVANSGNNTVSEINSSANSTTTLSPSVGYQSGSKLISAPSAVAVDNSGNVWVTNQGNSTVTEIIGSAKPVTTPLAALAPGVAP